MKRESTESPPNLLELRPSRNIQWNVGDDEKVTLRVPKFKHPLLVKWIVPMLAKPEILVKLDSFGSFLWNRCDGRTTVEQLGREMAERFGEPVDDLYDRIGKFLGKLARGKLIRLDQPSSAGSPNGFGGNV